MVNIRSKSEAKKLGLKYYFTGKPCKYGHVAERRVCNSTCKECHLIAVKEHDKTRSGYFRDYNNTEERKLYMKEYGVNYENKEIVHAKYFPLKRAKVLNDLILQNVEPLNFRELLFGPNQKLLGNFIKIVQKVIRLIILFLYRENWCLVFM